MLNRPGTGIQKELKMNLEKRVFRIITSHFLGFLLHRKEIEVDKKKNKAVLEASPTKNKLELQRLIRKINFLKRFIENLTSKLKSFSPLLQLRRFCLGKEQEEAFDHIKQALASSLMLVPPIEEACLKLYASAAENSIGCLLAQETDDKKDRAMYYLRRLLVDIGCRYTTIEKLCLSFYFACTKLEYYVFLKQVFMV